MEFYKKNPEIKGTIFVQGEEIDDEKVVCGEKFRIFADPSTFPGKPPKLVKTELESLDSKQISDVKKQVKEEAAKPPRHLGVIKSTQFDITRDTGEMRLENRPERPNEAVLAKLEAEVEEEIIPEKVEKVEEVKLISESDLASKTLKEIYTVEQIIDVFPGITDKNAEAFMNMFDKVHDVSVASNVDLRRLGVPSNYFRRLRDRASDILKDQE